nr:MAG TPA: hypothetical protein [Caudoviricetes sp.]
MLKIGNSMVTHLMREKFFRTVMKHGCIQPWS